MKTVLVTVASGLALPFFARIPGAIFHGARWITDFSSGMLDPFFVGFELIPIALIAIIGLFRKRIPFWAAVIPAFGFSLYGHLVLDLTADAQAAIALIWIPIWSAVAAVVGGFCGFLYQGISIIRSRAVRGA